MKVITRFFQTYKTNLSVVKIMMGLLMLPGLFVNAQTPVAYYPFSGNANDAIGANNGTVNGAILTTDRFGNANSAYSFDGVNDNISCNFATNLSSAFTVSCWYKMPSLPTANTLYEILSKRSLCAGSFTDFPFGLSVNSSGNVTALFSKGDDFTAENILQSAPLSVNQWYFITAAYSANNEIGLYINGVQAASAAINYAVSTNGQNWTIGSASQENLSGCPVTNTHANGMIDEVKIHNTALTAAQVLNEYNTSSNNLVAYYPFNGNADDAIGTNNGTVNGATLATDRFGNANSAYSFDGVDDVVIVPNNTALNFSGDFTISLWSKSPVSQANTDLVDKGMLEKWDDLNVNIGYPFGIRYNYLTNSAVFVRYDGTTVKRVEGNTAINDNQWHYITATLSGAMLSFYIDGVLQNSLTDFTDLTNITNSKNLHFGNRQPGGSNQYTGVLDEVKIHNTALTAAQILNEYNTSSNNLVAYYPFTGNANDAAGTNNGTVNGATLTTDRFGNANSAYSFDGVDDFIGLNYNFGPFTELTVSAWYKVTATSPELQAIVSSDHTAKLLHMQISTSGDADNAVYFNPGPGNLVLTHPMPVLNQWRQVTISSKSGESKLYINGVLTDTDNSTFTSTTAADLLRIGSGYLNGRFFNGVIDEVKIYNTALTAAQIIVDMGNIPLPIAVCCGGSNAGCSSSSANNMNGGSASGFGCGGGGAGYFGGHGGNGLYGGGGGGAAGFNQPNRSGGAGGTGVVVVEMLNAQNELVERNAYTGGLSFVVPANVTSAHVWAIGAGGGGAGATGSDGTSGGGGGAGGVAYKSFNVNSGDIFTYTLGVAGAGGVDASDGYAGTNTTVTFNSTTLIGGGGEGGKYNTNIDAQGGTFSGGDGGSNGGNGKGAASDSGGGAGGGIGLSANLSISCAGGVGANANDVSGLFEVLTAQQVILIADYHFNGNAADNSGNDLHGTIIGSPTFATDRNGLANGAIVFDGNVANRVEVNDTSLLHAASITIAAWVKFNSLGGIQTIVHKTLGSGSSDSWTHGTENSNLSSWHFNNAGGGPYSQVTSPIVSNQWYYAVSTFDNTTKQHKLYIDGILKATNTFNNLIGYDNSKMYFGAGIENGGLDYPMNGVVDEVKIYGSALTAGQISDEYENAVGNSLPGSGNALSFDGVNDNVYSTPQQTVFDNFTMETWVNPIATTPLVPQSTTGAEGASGTHRYLAFPVNGSVYGNGNTQAGAGFSVGTNGICVFEHAPFYLPSLLTWTGTITGWTHIAVVYTNKQPSLYVNGVLAATGLTSPRAQVFASNSEIGGGAYGFFQGQADEIRIWNTALTESQIRDRMCRKITSADALYSNLAAYYNFDESTGNTAFDASANANNGTLVNGPTRVTSGAAIGNTSAHSYAGASSSINLAHPTRGDDFTATLTAGAAAGIQVYHVNEEPNTRTGVPGLASNNAYFGTFVVGGSSPALNAVYNYDGIPNIASEVGLGLFGRNNNSITAWNAENAVINTTANTLSLNGITGTQKEFIVGENSAGTISSSQSSCLAIVPDPLTGTAAFNGVPGVTYQWQDSIVGGTWTNIQVLPMAQRTPRPY